MASTIYEPVKKGGTDLGSLSLSSEALTFAPTGKKAKAKSPDPLVVRWSDVKKHQCNPAKHAKALLKIVTHDGTSTTFQLKNRSMLEDLHADISKRRREQSVVAGDEDGNDQQQQQHEESPEEEKIIGCTESTIYHQVTYDSIIGDVTLSADTLRYDSSDLGVPLAIAWNQIVKHQASPPKRAKALLKLTLVDGDEVILGLPNRQDLERFQKDIARRRKSYDEKNSTTSESKNTKSSVLEKTVPAEDKINVENNNVVDDRHTATDTKEESETPSTTTSDSMASSTTDEMEVANTEKMEQDDTTDTTEKTETPDAAFDDVEKIGQEETNDTKEKSSTEATDTAPDKSVSFTTDVTESSKEEEMGSRKKSEPQEETNTMEATELRKKNETTETPDTLIINVKKTSEECFHEAALENKIFKEKTNEGNQIANEIVLDQVASAKIESTLDKQDESVHDREDNALDSEDGEARKAQAINANENEIGEEIVAVQMDGNSSDQNVGSEHMESTGEMVSSEEEGENAEVEQDVTMSDDNDRIDGEEDDSASESANESSSGGSDHGSESDGEDQPPPPPPPPPVDESDDMQGSHDLTTTEDEELDEDDDLNDSLGIFETVGDNTPDEGGTFEKKSENLEAESLLSNDEDVSEAENMDDSLDASDEYGTKTRLQGQATISEMESIDESSIHLGSLMNDREDTDTLEGSSAENLDISDEIPPDLPNGKKKYDNDQYDPLLEAVDEEYEDDEEDAGEEFVVVDEVVEHVEYEGDVYEEDDDFPSSSEEEHLEGEYEEDPEMPSLLGEETNSAGSEENDFDVLEGKPMREGDVWSEEDDEGWSDDEDNNRHDHGEWDDDWDDEGDGEGISIFDDSNADEFGSDESPFADLEGAAVSLLLPDEAIPSSGDSKASEESKSGSDGDVEDDASDSDSTSKDNVEDEDEEIQSSGSAGSHETDSFADESIDNPSESDEARSTSTESSEVSDEETEESEQEEEEYHDPASAWLAFSENKDEESFPEGKVNVPKPKRKKRGAHSHSDEESNGSEEHPDEDAEAFDETEDLDKGDSESDGHESTTSNSPHPGLPEEFYNWKQHGQSQFENANAESEQETAQSKAFDWEKYAQRSGDCHNASSTTSPLGSAFPEGEDKNTASDSDSGSQKSASDHNEKLVEECTQRPSEADPEIRVFNWTSFAKGKGLDVPLPDLATTNSDESVSEDSTESPIFDWKKHAKDHQEAPSEGEEPRPATPSNPSGVDLLKLLMGTKEEEKRSTMLNRYLAPPSESPEDLDARVSPEDLLDAISKFVDMVRTVKQSDNAPEITSARQVAIVARLAIIENYGDDSEVLTSFESGLAPAFAPKFGEDGGNEQ